MIAVITGDIISSSKATTRIWLKILITELGKSSNDPRDWEIYRGDSFQLLIKNPLNALFVAIKIKAAIKSVQGLDVRMAIGIGDREHRASKITQSNGSAFVHSGEKFELLKKEKQNLAIKTHSPDLDEEINLYLKLCLIVMDDWTPNAAEAVKLGMENPEKSQKELGKLMGIQQNAVSGRLKRAHYDEILEVIKMYKNKLKRMQ